jgi:hypothetical protein
MNNRITLCTSNLHFPVSSPLTLRRLNQAMRDWRRRRA